MYYSHRLRTAPEIIDFSNAVKLDIKLLPRLIIGLAYAHEQLGKLPWPVLLKPSIDLAK